MSSGGFEIHGDRAEVRWYNLQGVQQDLKKVLNRNALCLGQQDRSVVLVCHQQAFGALEQRHTGKQRSLLLLRLLPPVLRRSFLGREPVRASAFPLGQAHGSSKAEGRVPAKAEG